MSFVRRFERILPSLARGRSFISRPDIVYDFQLPPEYRSSDISVLAKYKSDYIESQEFAATFSALDMLKMSDIGMRPIVPSISQNLPNLLENSYHFGSFSTDMNDFQLIQDSHFVITAKYQQLGTKTNVAVITGESNGVCVGMDGDSESNTGLAAFHCFSPFLSYHTLSGVYESIDNQGNALWEYYKNGNDQTNVFKIPKDKANYPSNAAAVLTSVEIQFGDWMASDKQISIDFNDTSNIIGMCSGKDIITFKLPEKRKEFLKLYSINDFSKLGLNENGKVFSNMVGSPFLLTDLVKDVHGTVLSKSQLFRIYGAYKTQAWIGLNAAHITENWIEQPAIVKDNKKRLLNHSLPKLPCHSGSAGLFEPGYQASVHIRSNNAGTMSVTNDATLVDESVLSKY